MAVFWHFFVSTAPAWPLGTDLWIATRSKEWKLYGPFLFYCQKCPKLWELSGEDGLLDAYRKELALYGKAPDEMKPVVRITTSDTGSGGANIFPMLVCGKEGTTISLGSPLRLGQYWEVRKIWQRRFLQ